MLAVVAMAAFSCIKENDTIKAEKKVIEPKVITAFTDADVNPDTKTSLDGVCVLWATTDAIKGIQSTGEVHTSTSTAVSGENKRAEFTFSTVSVEDDLQYLAYPAENTDMALILGEYEAYATLPTTQTATANSFANKANIAVAKGLDANPVFKNVGGLLSFTINNNDITSVTISANESLTGAAKISLAEATFAEADITGGWNFVTVSGTIVNGTTYYAVVYPGTYTGLKIEVRNSSGQVATYTNPNSLTVTRNCNLHIATLTIPAGKWVTPTAGTTYTWNLASGDLGTTPAGDPPVIPVSVSKGLPSLTWYPSYSWTASQYLGWNSTNGVQVGKSDNECTRLYLSTDYPEYVENIRINFTQAVGGAASVSVSVHDVAFKCGGVTSVSATDNTPSNYIFTSTELVKGVVEITFSNTASKAFYIKSIEINPDLRTPQSLSFPQAAYSVELSEGTFASPILSGANTTVTYSSDDEDVATVNASTGLVTLKTTGTVNITATAAANETYQAGFASYSLVVNPGPSSIATVIAADNNTSVYTSGVVAQINHKGFVITDGTNNIFVYKNAEPTEVVAGQAVKISGTRGTYNNVPQVASPIITTGATGQDVTRTTLTAITSSNATGHTSSQYVSLAGVLSKSGSYYNISIAGSSVQGSLYAVNDADVFTAGALSTLNGKGVTVTGYIIGSSASYLNIAPVDIVLNAAVPTMSTTPANGSTIEWDDDKYDVGNAETITVTQNGEASGYTVSYTDSENAWTISDDGTGTITVYPKAANGSTTTDKTLVVTITHDDDGVLTSVITLKQNKKGASSKTYTITWNSTNNSSSVGGYTSTWFVTADGLRCDMNNWNNNNNGWAYVKCGRKDNASVATIISHSAIPEAIRTVKVTIDALTSSKINSIKLFISANGSDWAEESSFTKGTGEKSVVISSPAANKYYKIEVDCASGSSNGLLTLSQLVFTTE